MTLNIYEEYDFMYKGQTIHIYRKGKDGEVYIARDDFNQLSTIKFSQEDAVQDLIEKQKLYEGMKMK